MNLNRVKIVSSHNNGHLHLYLLLILHLHNFEDISEEKERFWRQAIIDSSIITVNDVIDIYTILKNNKLLTKLKDGRQKD